MLYFVTGHLLISVIWCNIYSGKATGPSNEKDKPDWWFNMKLGNKQTL